jgi:hypothetical protein
MRTMRKPVAILAALAWLGLIVITTPIPFIHLVEWHGFLDTMGIIFLIVAYSGFILAIAAAVSARRWLSLLSFIFSLPAAGRSLLSLSNVIFSLRWRFGLRPPGVTVFLWLSLIVVLVTLCMPVLWGAVCFQLRGRKT